MYSIKRWSPRDNPKQVVWYVAEDGICVFEARKNGKPEAEAYLADILRSIKA